MKLKINKGVNLKAQKVIIYGLEGIGKTSLLSDFPEPLFIDTEGSSNFLNVKRVEKPKSWEQLKNIVVEVIKAAKNGTPYCKTLVIDTFDWAEKLCLESICMAAGKSGIEEFGYGQGYTFNKEEIGRFLDLLEDVIDTGTNVAISAHSQIRRVEQPELSGSYDRYEMKLGNQKTTGNTSALLREWADIVLFCNYKVFIQKEGNKNKAYGGERVMHTCHSMYWDAKNRCDLAEELPLSFNSIRDCIPNGEDNSFNFEEVDAPKVEEIKPKKTVKREVKQKTKEVVKEVKTKKTEAKEVGKKLINDMAGVPEKLQQLMKNNNVTVGEIQKVVASKGYFPIDTPFVNYPADFVNAVLIAAWKQVEKAILDNREVPF